jgi:hypothetical protein
MPVSISGTNGVTFPDSSLQAAAASPNVLKNRIINGAMTIAQRGTSFSFGSGGGALYYGTDRFYTDDYNWSAGSNITISQDTTVYPTGFNYSYKWANGATGLTFGSGGYQRIGTRIEGYNLADAYSSIVTLSFWVRSSTVGTYTILCTNNATSYQRYIEITYTISVANTWEYKSVQINLATATSAGTWNTTNGMALDISWMLGAASNRTGDAALNTWITESGTYNWQSSSSVQLATIANSTFYITGVQLEVGSTATPFERRLYNQELANCQRYFEVISNLGATYSGGGIGQASSTTRAYIQIPLKVNKRASPSLSFTTAGNFILTNNANAGLTVTSLAQDTVGPYSISCEANVASGLTAGNATRLLSFGTADGSIYVSAEL